MQANIRVGGENFPVASWFIRPRHREAVRAYYAFARTADDIADDPATDTARKLERLDTLEREFDQNHHGTLGGRLRATFDHRNIPATCARDLLVAFRRDARSDPIRTLGDLTDYCRYSAAPVGRFLLALHDESDGAAESDALCEALQLLNHAQDCRDDLETMKRCYLPAEWLDEAGLTVDTLANEDNAAARLTVLRRLIEHAADCLSRAADLPRALTDRGLAAQADTILRLAHRLLAKLCAKDPWRARIALAPTDWILAGAAGFRSFLGR